VIVTVRICSEKGEGIALASPPAHERPTRGSAQHQGAVRDNQPTDHTAGLHRRNGGRRILRYAAEAESLSNCAANCGNQCVTYVSVLNSCAAIAVGTDPALHQEFSTATNSLVEMARKQALSKNGGGVIGASGCTTNLVVDSPPQSPDTGTG
jgi:hypothetical protein